MNGKLVLAGRRYLPVFMVQISPDPNALLRGVACYTPYEDGLRRVITGNACEFPSR